MSEQEAQIWEARANEAIAANNDMLALESLDRALTLRPGDASLLNSKGAALGRLGRYNDALAAFRTAVAQLPESPDLHFNIGFALQCLGRRMEALKAYDRALELRPVYPNALNNRGLTLTALGRCAEAVASLQSALQISPNDPLLLNNLGHAYFVVKMLPEARSAFEGALRIAPKYVDARSNLARCLVLQGDHEEAIRNFEIALSVDPCHAASVEGLAVAYGNAERYDGLAVALRKLAGQAPEAAGIWAELGSALSALNRSTEAEDCFARSVQLDPSNAAARLRIGRSLLEMGEIEKAVESFEKACALQPRAAYNLYLLATSRKVIAGDQLFVWLGDLLSEQDDLEINDRAYLHFALGKALADIGENERAFSHLLEGNNLKRKLVEYNEKKTLDDLSETVRLFSPALVARCDRPTKSSGTPIFILGMPRTGSTLMEQILAAHSQVVALGEMRVFEGAIRSLDKKMGTEFPAWLPHVGEPEISDLGDLYSASLLQVARARGLSDQRLSSVRLVDKTPGNFRYLGLIRLALPDARIIHTRRDPVDTCLSCFQRLFATVPFSYDLGELGRFYRHHELLMEHWRKTLPENSFLTVDYERLVGRLEEVCREVVSFCGLEWEDACLQFHRVKRSVRTASAAQVRVPLFNTSVGKRRPSMDLLKPLMGALSTGESSGGRN